MLAERGDRGGPLGEALDTVLAAGSDMAHEQAIEEFVAERARVHAWIVDGRLARRGARGSCATASASAPTTRRNACAPPIIAESAFAHADFVRLIGLLRPEAASATRTPPSGWRPISTRSTTRRAPPPICDFCTKADGELRAAGSLVTKAVKDRWAGLAETHRRPSSSGWSRCSTASPRPTATRRPPPCSRLADATIAAYAAA